MFVIFKDKGRFGWVFSWEYFLFEPFVASVVIDEQKFKFWDMRCYWCAVLVDFFFRWTFFGAFLFAVVFLLFQFSQLRSSCSPAKRAFFINAFSILNFLRCHIYYYQFFLLFILFKCSWRNLNEQFMATHYVHDLLAVSFESFISGS